MSASVAVGSRVISASIDSNPGRPSPRMTPNSRHGCSWRTRSIMSAKSKSLALSGMKQARAWAISVNWLTSR